MALIPTFVVYGGVQITGAGSLAQLAQTGYPTLQGIALNYPRFARVVPSGADGVTGGTFDPYWDGTLNAGAGGFTKFAHAPGYLGILGNGDNWFLPPPAPGISLMPLLMNTLWDRFPTAPGFKMLKVYVPGGWGTGDAMKPGGAGWTAFMAEWTAMVADMALSGHTPDVQGVILDGSFEDIKVGNLTYVADLQQTLTGIRDNLSATAPIWIINHHQQLYAGGMPNFAGIARLLNQQVTGLPGVKLFDMNWAQFGADTPFYGGIPEGPLRQSYRQLDYLETGARLGRAIQAYYTNAPNALATSRGIPTVVIVADSQGETFGTNPTALLLGGSGSFLGNGPGSTQREGQYIWNNVDRQTQLYDVLSNPSTLGEGFAAPVFGPEMSMLARLAEHYPDGVVVWKYARAGAALTYEATFFGATAALEPAANLEFLVMKAAFADFLQTIHRDLGRQADVRHILFSIGGNDTLHATTAAAYAARLPAFIDAYRDLFTTRSDGEPTDVVLLEVSPPALTNVNGTNYGDPAAREVVRSAQRALPSLRPRVKVLLDDGRELLKGEMIHYSTQEVIDIGYEIAEAFISFDEAVADADSTVSVPSETAAFVVEDGTGLATANAFADLAYVSAYAALHGNPLSWSSLSQSAQKDFIRQATRWISIRFAYQGKKLNVNQALSFPRYELFDEDGYSILSNIVPRRVKDAMSVVTLRMAQGDWTPFPDEAAAAQSGSESISVGPISISTSDASSQTTEAVLSIVKRLLAPFIRRAAHRIGRG